MKMEARGIISKVRKYRHSSTFYRKVKLELTKPKSASDASTPISEIITGSSSVSVDTHTINDDFVISNAYNSDIKIPACNNLITLTDKYDLDN